jgi:hypothetical protein
VEASAKGGAGKGREEIVERPHSASVRAPSAIDT